MTVAVRLGAVAVAAVVAAVLILNRPGPNRLAQAQHLVQRDSRFQNGPKAGAAFADLSHLLLDDAKSCARRRSPSDQRCAARYSAAAHTSVAAFALLRCTQPGVYRARRDLMIELSGIVAIDRQKGNVPPPSLPGFPSC
jgi:hypothetical protein